MTQWTTRLLAVSLTAVWTTTVDADSSSYEQEFLAEVAAFANLNRLRYGTHRDVHVDCYIPVTIATTIVADGSVSGIFIAESSSAPIVDRYFRFVIEQAAPYQPLANHYDPAPEEITITHEFRLDVRLWSDGIRSVRACDKLEVREVGEIA